MLRFYFGVMGSSKSAMLLMQRYNYLELGHCVALVKPEVDTRVAREVVYVIRNTLKYVAAQGYKHMEPVRQV